MVGENDTWWLFVNKKIDFRIFFCQGRNRSVRHSAASLILPSQKVIKLFLGREEGIVRLTVLQYILRLILTPPPIIHTIPPKSNTLDTFILQQPAPVLSDLLSQFMRARE
jgi:hypothetical protein